MVVSTVGLVVDVCLVVVVGMVVVVVVVVTVVVVVVGFTFLLPSSDRGQTFRNRISGGWC